MRRRLLNLLTALSLLLCVAVVAVWVRSYWVCEIAQWRANRSPDDSHYEAKMYAFTSLRGTWEFYVQRLDYDFSSDPPSKEAAASFREQMPTPGWHHESREVDLLPPTRHTVNRFGFGWERLAANRPDENERYESRTARLPVYLPAVLTALFPLVWIYRRLRPWRNRSGLCPSCGYDLRATPGRCPECGAAGGLAGGR